MTMRARVRDGRLTLDEPTDLPEGSEVDVAIIDGGDDLDDDERERLHDALERSHEQMLRGETIPAEEVLAKLRAKRA